MQPKPTVIGRFVDEVVAELQRRDADGAARHVYEAGAVLEPAGRSNDADSERQRLLLLADRAARHWVPTTMSALDASSLVEIARQHPPVRSERDAVDAAGRLRDVRTQLRRLPATVRAAQPATISSALAGIQKLLAAVGEPASEAAGAGEVRAIGWAARGLVACFYAGAPFSDGLPGEVRATTTVLDALDDERLASWGSPGSERTARESGLHRTLVAVLMSELALGFGEITHAEDGGLLPRPHRVGRHRPDLIGRVGTGELFLGEAKLGPELNEQHTQEQLADFLAPRPDGELVALHLIVPLGWRGQAEAAAIAAAGSGDGLIVHEADVEGALPPA